jgi:hypothetical protein
LCRTLVLVKRPPPSKRIKVEDTCSVICHFSLELLEYIHTPYSALHVHLYVLNHDKLCWFGHLITWSGSMKVQVGSFVDS